MASVIPPSTAELNKGPALLAIYWVQFSVGLVFVILRFYARFSIRAIGWDDWTIAIALILDLVTTIIQHVLIKSDVLKQNEFDSLDQIYTLFKLYWILQPFATMAVAIARVSVAVLMLRLIGPSIWRKRFLYFSIISTLLVSLVYSIIVFIQCSPITRLWNIDGAGTCSMGIIFAVQILAPFTSSWNAFMDICLAAVPIFTFSRLQMKARKKSGLCVLMGFGMIASIAAAIKAWKYTALAVQNFTFAYFNLFAVSGVELLLLIVCSCTPTLKPLYDRIRRYWIPKKRNSKLFLSARPSYYPVQPDLEVFNTAEDHPLEAIYQRDSKPLTNAGEHNRSIHTVV